MNYRNIMRVQLRLCFRARQHKESCDVLLFKEYTILGMKLFDTTKGRDVL